MNWQEQRQFVIALIKSWADAGMERQAAVDLYNEIANSRPVPITSQPTEATITKPDTRTRQQLVVLESLSKDERRVFLLAEQVELEQSLLKDLILEWKESRSKQGLDKVREQRRRVQKWVKRLNQAKLKREQSQPRNES